MQLEKLNIQNSTSNDINLIIINNILVNLNKKTCLTYPLKLKYPPCKTYRKKRVGGQLMALAVSAAETAYGYASGAIQGLGGLLNMATSAVGVGFDALGGLVKSAFSAVKTAGKVVGTVVKNVVTSAGNFINKGFRVSKNGSLDWRMNKKDRKSAFSDFGVDFAGGVAGDTIGDMIGDKAGFNIGGSRIGYGKLASGFAREAVNYGHTGDFRVNMFSMGAIMDMGDTKSWGGSGNQNFMQKFGQNLYNSDADISRARSTGLGMTFNRKGVQHTYSVSGGFDMSDITIAAIRNPLAIGEAFYGAVKGIATGIGAVATAGYRVFAGDRDTTERDSKPNKPLDKNKTIPTEAILLKGKRKGIITDENSEDDSSNKKLYNEEDKKIKETNAGMNKWEKKKKKAEKELKALQSKKNKYKTAKGKKEYKRQEENLKNRIKECNKYYNNNKNRKVNVTNIKNELIKMDKVIDKKVAEFNKTRGYKPGDKKYLDPDLIKVQTREESGKYPFWIKNDPMQMNNLKKDRKTGKTDWDNEKAKLGLRQNEYPGQELSIESGIRWLYDKGERYIPDENNRGRLMPKWDGWEKALERYNGNQNITKRSSPLKHKLWYRNTIWKKYKILHK